jgi:urease accessory protein
MLIATPAEQHELELVQKLNDEQLAATLINDLLVVRYLGDSTQQCRESFTRIWSRIRPSVIGRQPSPPRIWST